MREGARFVQLVALSRNPLQRLIGCGPMTSIQSFFETAARLGPRLCWKYGARDISWSEAARLVRQVARALISLGVKPGDAVAIIGPNRPEWMQADLGAIAAGAVPAPIYPTLAAEQAVYIAAHSEAVVAVVRDAAQLAKLRTNRPPKLRWFVLLEGRPDAKDVLGWDEFLARGEGAPGAAVDQRLAALEPEGLATLIYTSGTTGPPKAVMLVHRSLDFAARTAKRIGEVTEADVLVSYLPLSHVAEQMISIHGPTVSGAAVWFCDDVEQLGAVLRAARPTIFFGVPRVWEKLQNRLEQGIAEAPPLKRRLLGWARRSRGAFADKLVLSPLRRKLGLDRARFCVTGAAAMPLTTLQFFDSLGLPILDVWGMTESTAMGSANLPAARKPGTVGRPAEGIEIRIAPDGEILTRGPHLFRGYFKDAAATREALDAEGFLHTGDVGELDGDGYLRITDRKKDLLITSGGKNVSPQNIEAQLGRIAGVSQAVVVGDARKYLAALIVPEVPEKAADPAFVAHVGREIEKVNGQLAQYETIKKFRVLRAQFTVDSGELTPTLKLKRKVVAQRYAREIEELFA
jgi:long-subunit acyl-CoA synthetase (AMP-forming)